MKQAAILIAGIIMMPFILVSGVSLLRQNTSLDEQLASRSAQVQEEAIVTLEVRDGETTRTIPDVTAINALDALKKAAEQEEFEVKTKTFVFGTQVTAIDGKENTDDMAWMYYINDEVPSVGADKQELETGDTVSWRYMKPE